MKFALPCSLLLASIAMGQGFGLSVSFGPPASPGIAADPYGDGPLTSRSIALSGDDEVTHGPTELGLLGGNLTGISDGTDDVTFHGPYSVRMMYAAAQQELAGRWVAAQYTLHPGSTGSQDQTSIFFGRQVSTIPSHSFWVTLEDGVSFPPDLLTDSGSNTANYHIDAIGMIVDKDRYPIYFTLDQAAITASAANLPAASYPSCIFMKASPTAPTVIFKDHAALGIQSSDEVDAISYDAADDILAFSLRAGASVFGPPNDPTTGAYIFTVDFGAGATTPPHKWAEPADLQLRPEDDISALFHLDPVSPMFGRGQIRHESPIELGRATMLVNGQNGSAFGRVLVDIHEDITVTLRPTCLAPAVVLVMEGVPSTNMAGSFNGMDLIYNPQNPAVKALASSIPIGGVQYPLPALLPSNQPGYSFVIPAVNSPFSFTIQPIYYADSSSCWSGWASGNAIVVVGR